MKAAIIAALAFAVSGTAHGAIPRWNPKAPENNELLPSFTPSNVEAVLVAIGARHERTRVAGKSGFNVTFPNGRKAVVSLGACNADGSMCKSLSMQSSWTRIANAPAERTAEAVQRFNQRYSFGKAYLTADARPGMERYLTADYGFIRGNLAVNFLVFANQVDRFANQVLQPLEAKR